LQSRLKGSLEWFSRMNKKYLMPFHTYLTILALALAIVHLMFSSCPNPFPEWGLGIAGILVATGLLIKLRIAAKISPKLTKWVYQFHASLVVTGILVSVLLTGHLLMD
jgi:membrane protein YdbS with pleckstrin-like domain